jgi:hypothetical protein
LFETRKKTSDDAVEAERSSSNAFIEAERLASGLEKKVLQNQIERVSGGLRSIRFVWLIMYVFVLWTLLAMFINTRNQMLEFLLK